MKKIMVPILLLACLLSGCSRWMDGEYHSVTPHESDGIKVSEDVVTVSDYPQLRDALLDMVGCGKQSSTFYVTGMDADKIERFMHTAITHICRNTPVGAYAVDEIRYESGISGGVAALAVDIDYVHGRQEILRIKNVPDMEAAQRLIGTALNQCDASVVIQVEHYETMDAEIFVQDYVNANPHLCMELPQVAATTYPETGDERIIEISFTYQTSRDALRIMQDMVTPVFAAAELYVQGSEGENQKYEQLYAFLMERFDYKIEPSITPAYSLLRYGVGDSKAFARVYSIMCQNADLECQVVTGTKNGEAYYWNQIRIEDATYYVDLLACSGAGEFAPRTEEEMTGYVWDYSQFQ